MRETKTIHSLALEVVNPATGNTFKVEGQEIKVGKYYSVKRITSRVNAMDLLTTLSKICKSPKDILLMNTLLDESNQESRIVLTNISAKAKELNIARSKLNNLLATAVTEHFLYKTEKGTYFINPYIFIGRKVRSNETREKLQREWLNLTSNLAYLRDKQ